MTSSHDAFPVRYRDAKVVSGVVARVAGRSAGVWWWWSSSATDWTDSHRRLKSAIFLRRRVSGESFLIISTVGAQRATEVTDVLSRRPTGSVSCQCHSWWWEQQTCCRWRAAYLASTALDAFHSTRRVASSQQRFGPTYEGPDGNYPTNLLNKSGYKEVKLKALDFHLANPSLSPGVTDMSHWWRREGDPAELVHMHQKSTT